MQHFLTQIQCYVTLSFQVKFKESALIYLYKTLHILLTKLIFIVSVMISQDDLGVQLCLFGTQITDILSKSCHCFNVLLSGQQSLNLLIWKYYKVCEIQKCLTCLLKWNDFLHGKCSETRLSKMWYSQGEFRSQFPSPQKSSGIHSNVHSKSEHQLYYPLDLAVEDLWYKTRDDIFYSVQCTALLRHISSSKQARACK